jgi:hypothetical protein
MTAYLYKKRKVYFLGDDLVSVEVKVPTQGIVKIKNWSKDKFMFMSIPEFKRVRKKAFTRTEAGELLNYSRESLGNLTRKGLLPRPIPRMPVNEDPNGICTYYKEETIYTMREILAGIHRGRPRKDGLKINNQVPTESELSAKLNKAYVVYLKTEDGTFVPTFPETI